ncbi:kinesin-like protein KIN-7N [Primulina tabacum]|uniref:kinesin-like protein KIN-7N n=1 Tax=Primulina tabacum TaxID=48773 RepID=UPI003F599DA2
MEKICVAVRVRPPSCEKSEDELHWKVENNSVSLHDGVHNSPIPGMSFAFDHVFDKDINNATVYDLLVKNIIQAAAEGFDGAIVAYGQTGSGKTFTMKGIIPRAVEDLFHDIQQMNVMFEFQIRVCCMQIYNEHIIDLLAEDNNQNLETAYRFWRGPYVRGLKEEIVNNVNQVLGLFQKASGRSVDLAHTLFVMIIESNPKCTYSSSGSTSDAVGRLSVLNLVDLAGSKRTAETQAEEEGEHTDKSLMVLSDVINKLSEGGKQRVHIPYCDSKLTYILQHALGGNAKTSIICTIAPEKTHIEETKGTLQFASRAKNVTNCVKVNEASSEGKLLDEVFKKQEVQSPCS